VRLALQQSDFFWADLTKQVDWYREHATPEIAVRFVNAAGQVLNLLRKPRALAGSASSSGRS